MKPLVSVLTPSFNQATWLSDNLRSVASQTYRPIEHIVMDGGSTDGSVDILKQHARPELSWRSEPDTGQSHALNKAFERSRGEVIGWLNSDDAYCDRRTVEWMVGLFEKYPNVDVAYGYALLVDEINTVLQVIGSPPFSRRLLHAVNYIYQPTVFLRRRAVEAEATFVRQDLRFVMDRDLWLRLSKRCRFRRLARPVAVDRHQRYRKVASADFLTEAKRFDESNGIQNSVGARLLSTVAGLYMRAAGLPSILFLPWQVQQAIRLRVPPLMERAWRQGAVRRREFAYAPEDH
jgi:glycosyltransferase involved in cell wall biosynthesis